MEKVKKKAKTFSLCAFYNYEVEYLCNYCYLNEDGDFSNKTAKQSYQIDGGQFIDKIAKLILNSNCTSFTILQNEIIIEHFDPNSGETADYDYKIKELKTNVFEKKEEK